MGEAGGGHQYPDGPADEKETSPGEHRAAQRDQWRKAQAAASRDKYGDRAQRRRRTARRTVPSQAGMIRRTPPGNGAA